MASVLASGPRHPLELTLQNPELVDATGWGGRVRRDPWAPPGPRWDWPSPAGVLSLREREIQQLKGLSTGEDASWVGLRDGGDPPLLSCSLHSCPHPPCSGSATRHLEVRVPIQLQVARPPRQSPGSCAHVHSRTHRPPGKILPQQQRRWDLGGSPKLGSLDFFPHDTRAPVCPPTLVARVQVGPGRETCLPRASSQFLRGVPETSRPKPWHHSPPTPGSQKVHAVSHFP